jgi:cyclophilin family peptidyl-prolyl cis-trans isomerase
MIQGGDPDSKDAAEGVRLGNGGTGYTVEAEFRPEIFHKKGVLAAARMGDRENPEKRSSACQFYIVQGKVWNDVGLKNQETRINNRHKQNLFQIEFEKQIKLDSAENIERDQAELMQMINDKVQSILETETPFSIPEAHKEVYKTLGGTPHLDGSYTVFGEVIEGLHIIDSIAAQKTDKYDRPLEDVKMKIRMLN